MRKLLSIFMILLAMSIALGHSIVPHHEHGFKVHLSLNCSSDCEESHHSDKKECISQMDEAILLSKEDNKCACGEHHEHYPVPLYTFLASFFIEQPRLGLDSVFDREYESIYSNLYTSIYIPQSQGLRAPPVNDFSI